MTIVNIIVLNDDLSNTPAMGVVVGVYDMTSHFVTQSTTDSSGTVSFTLSSPQYRIYLYKQGFSILQPYLLNVDTTKTSITYQVIGHQRTLPESLDPKTVRVSGYILDSSNRPKKNMELKFFHEYQLVSGENVITNTPVTYFSDNTGYFQFDLLRNQRYKHDYLTEQDLVCIKTPDRPALPLPDLIFPIPVNVAITPTTINVPLSGGPVNVPYTCTFSDYSTDRGMRDYWGWVVSHITPDGKISYGIGKTDLTITPLELGTTTITFTRQLRCDFKWDDAPTFISPTLTVNVI